MLHIPLLLIAAAICTAFGLASLPARQQQFSVSARQTGELAAALTLKQCLAIISHAIDNTTSSDPLTAERTVVSLSAVSSVCLAALNRFGNTRVANLSDDFAEHVNDSINHGLANSPKIFGASDDETGLMSVSRIKYSATETASQNLAVALAEINRTIADALQKLLLSVHHFDLMCYQRGTFLIGFEFVDAETGYKRRLTDILLDVFTQLRDQVLNVQRSFLRVNLARAQTPQEVQLAIQGETVQKINTSRMLLLTTADCHKNYQQKLTEAVLEPASQSLTSFIRREFDRATNVILAEMANITVSAAYRHWAAQVLNAVDTTTKRAQTSLADVLSKMRPERLVLGPDSNETLAVLVASAKAISPLTDALDELNRRILLSTEHLPWRVPNTSYYLPTRSVGQFLTKLAKYKDAIPDDAKNLRLLSEQQMQITSYRNARTELGSDLLLPYQALFWRVNSIDEALRKLSGLWTDADAYSVLRAANNSRCYMKNAENEAAAFTNLYEHSLARISGALRRASSMVEEDGRYTPEHTAFQSQNYTFELITCGDSDEVRLEGAKSTTAVWNANLALVMLRFLEVSRENDFSLLVLPNEGDRTPEWLKTTERYSTAVAKLCRQTVDMFDLLYQNMRLIRGSLNSVKPSLQQLEALVRLTQASKSATVTNEVVRIAEENGDLFKRLRNATITCSDEVNTFQRMMVELGDHVDSMESTVASAHQKLADGLEDFKKLRQNAPALLLTLTEELQ